MSIEAILKNPKTYYLLVPVAQYIFYLIHKAILGEYKTRLILETPIDIQLLFFGVHASYLLSKLNIYNKPDWFGPYFFLVVVTLLALIMASSILLRNSFIAKEQNRLLKSSLFLIIVWVFLVVATFLLLYTMTYWD